MSAVECKGKGRLSPIMLSWTMYLFVTAAGPIYIQWCLNQNPQIIFDNVVVIWFKATCLLDILFALLLVSIHVFALLWYTELVRWTIPFVDAVITCLWNFIWAPRFLLLVVVLFQRLTALTLKWNLDVTEPLYSK